MIAIDTEGVNMRRILEQTRKELIQSFWDKRRYHALCLLDVACRAASVDLATVDDLPLVVRDLGLLDPSRLVIDAFRASITFRVISGRRGTSRGGIHGRTRRAALIIPKPLAETWREGGGGEGGGGGG